LKLLKPAMALLAAACLASAQDPVMTLKVDVALVSLDVGVSDSRGLAVTTLTRDDFEVYEDGGLREIRNFSSAGAPYSTLLLFDASGSTQNQWPFLIQAVNGFLRGLGIGDRVSLATFANGVSSLLDWKPARGQALDIPLVAPPGGTGRTAFYEALEWASSEVRRIDGRRGVIVYTDGQDTAGMSPQEATLFGRARTAVAQSGVPFYFVGINTDLNPAAPVRTPQQVRARTRMEELARISGGRMFLPTRIEDVIPLYQEIARELGSVYTLGFAPARALDDGRYHRVEVRVRDPLLRVSQSRQGYGAADGRVTANTAPPAPASPPAPTISAVATNIAPAPNPPAPRSVLTGPDVFPYSIPRGAAIYIKVSGSLENDLRTAFQKRSVPLRIVTNEPDADFVLANEASPGNPPSITITNTRTGLVGFAFTPPGRSSGQAAAESIAAKVIEKINSGK
jgi:VWFA-related protein